LINPEVSGDNDLETSYYSSEDIKDSIEEIKEPTPKNNLEPKDILNRLRKDIKTNLVQQVIFLK